MSPNPILADIVRQLTVLGQRAGSACGAIPAAMKLACRVQSALEHAQEIDEQRPVIITLLGGTGAGKSQLFNALIGREEASPTSDAVRCFTSRPRAAIAPGDRPRLVSLEELGTEFVETGLAGLALIDTPDIDGALLENRTITRKIVELSDVLIYVELPDKRANEDIVREVFTWASRKRWYFVVNKVDLERKENLPRLRSDSDRRLKEIGLSADDRVRFLLCARQPDEYDFPRFKEALLGARPREAVRMLRYGGFLGYAAYAVQAEVREPIATLARQLGSWEKELNERVRAIYQQALQSAQVRGQLGILVREQTWRNVAERLAGPMVLPIWLRCRLAAFGASLQIGRLGPRGANPLGWAWAGAASLIAALQGTLPVRQVAKRLNSACRRDLDLVRQDAWQLLRENHLDGLATPDPDRTEGEAQDQEHRQTPGQTPDRILTDSLSQAAEKLLGPTTDREIQEQLQADVDHMTRKAAERITRWPTQLLANLLPLVMFGWTLYRIGAGWWQEKYLPGNFYLMASGLLACSFVPGYYWIGARIRAAGRRDPLGLLAELDEPAATLPLRTVRRRLAELVSESAQLRQTIDNLKTALAQDWTLGQFGVEAAGEERKAR